MENPAILKRIAAAEDQLEKSGGLKWDKYSQAAWSPSKLKLLSQCPYQYYLKYVLKVKNEEEIPDTAAADVGTIAHHILEYAIEGKDVGDAYRDAKMEHCGEYVGPRIARISEEGWQEKIVPLEYNITNFVEKIEEFKKANGVSNVYTELKLGVTKDWKKTTFFANDVYFRGIVDFTMEIPQSGYAPDFIVWDHKHGPAEIFGGIRNYEDQLNAYKPLINGGFKPASGIQAGINFIKAGKWVLGEYSPAEEITGRVTKQIEWNIDCAIDNVKEQGFFKHVAGGYCNYCEFKTMCKEKVLKPNELGTKKWFPIKEEKCIN